MRASNGPAQPHRARWAHVRAGTEIAGGAGSFAIPLSAPGGVFGPAVIYRWKIAGTKRLDYYFLDRYDIV